jgi:hypothetical protein
MSAPTPCFITPGEKLLTTKKDIQMQEYNLTFNNITFKIKLFLDEEKQQINILSNPNEKFIRVQYERLLSMEELIAKNKQFKSFDSIDEAFALLMELFKKNKIIIKEYKENLQLKLEVKLLSLSGNEQSFDINLYKKEIKKDILIDQLITKTISLEKELDEIKKDNEKRDKEIEILKKTVNELKKEIENKSQINQISNECCMNSRIVNDKSIEFVINHLKKIYHVNNDNTKFKPKLLYRGSRDGFEASTFHKKCDYIKGTLVLIENNKGIRFGGFTMGTWEGNYIAKIDENAFCFSISLKKIYKVIKGKEAIRSDPKYGPVFLNDIFGFRKDNLKMGESYYITACNYEGCELDYEINGGEKDIFVEKMEVYQILFE